jgi:hypothetical protein
MKNSLREVLVLGLILLLGACAQVVAPGGGPVDRAAPKAISYKPDSAKLAFNSRSIIIEFDEFIQLRDLSSQLIISPPLKKQPDISVRGKSLLIELDKDEQLRSNTTYSFYFGQAIQDLNENNPADNFRYIFSTGSFIDSLNVEGTVENAFDKKTEKGILVMLYSDMSDSVPYKAQPDYFARTTADGKFRISNVRQGSYKIIALKDLNANYLYDGEGEQLAYTADTVFSARKDNRVLRMFEEQGGKVSLKKYLHDQHGKVNIYLQGKADSLRVTALNNTDKGVQELAEINPGKDTITYWIKNFQKDSLFLQVSNGSEILDTVELKTIKLEDAMKSKKRPFRLRSVNSLEGNQNVNLDQELTLQMSQPVASIQPLPVQFRRDTVLQKNVVLIQDSVDQKKLRLVQIDSAKGGMVSKIKLLPEKNYSLLILPGTVADMFGLQNDSISMRFKTREEKYYGSLALHVSIPSDDKYIIQLLNEKDAVIRQNNIVRLADLSYQYLQPGRYRLKLIHDKNGNGKWDTGYYLRKEQPEEVLFNSESIMIRSNWDAELEWEIK